MFTFETKVPGVYNEALLGNGPPSISGLGEIAAGTSQSSTSPHSSPQLNLERSRLAALLLLLALVCYTGWA